MSTLKWISNTPMKSQVVNSFIKRACDISAGIWHKQLYDKYLNILRKFWYRHSNETLFDKCSNLEEQYNRHKYTLEAISKTDKRDATFYSKSNWGATWITYFLRKSQ